MAPLKYFDGAIKTFKISKRHLHFEHPDFDLTGRTPKTYALPSEDAGFLQL